MSAHTPGPWVAHIDKPRNPKRMALIATSNGSACIDATKSGADYEQDCANARLIAAAPDLLAALIEGVDRCAHEDGCRWWIANISELNTPEARAANDAECNCVIGEMRAAIAKAEAA